MSTLRERPANCSGPLDLNSTKFALSSSISTVVYTLLQNPCAIMAPRKKPFQPSLHSFWGHSSASSLPPNTPMPPPTLAPKLPSPVQSSLLNVGMRVRKAVPEGYKTKLLPSPSKPIPDFAAFDVFGAPSQTPAPIQMQTDPFPTTFTSRPAELVPYSGIERIGGLTRQPMSSFIDEGYVSLPASQEPLSQQPFTPSNKRRLAADFEADDEESSSPQIPSSPTRFHNTNLVFAPLIFSDAPDFADVPVSPRSTAASLNGRAGVEVNSTRLKATPRSRRKRADTLGDEENCMQVDGNDFEEASFLRRLSEDEADGDLAMAGF
ncbi:MAG: hypothetical protein M1814_005571 [Vezdaea aestivalis]|nr:MAG: hypothetical protein M1814_005571 [Vezdaea aestivalis]